MDKKKRTRTPEQREAWNAYLRAYRRDNPEKVKAWKDNYIKRRAAKLAKMEAEIAKGVSK